MSQPEPNEANTPPRPAATGRALGVARLVIALGLLIGVAVLGISAVNDLMDGLDAAQTGRQTANPQDPGQWGPHSPGFEEPSNLDQVVAGLGSETHTRIDRDPGRLAPPANAARSIALLIREREGQYRENAQYRVNNASVDDVIRHYQRVAQDAGFKPLTQGPVEGGGLNVSLTRNGQVLIVRAWPVDPSELPPVRPPLQARAVNLNVSLQYPIDDPPPRGQD